MPVHYQQQPTAPYYSQDSAYNPYSNAYQQQPLLTVPQPVVQPPIAPVLEAPKKKKRTKCCACLFWLVTFALAVAGFTMAVINLTSFTKYQSQFFVRQSFAYKPKSSDPALPAIASLVRGGQVAIGWGYRPAVGGSVSNDYYGPYYGPETRTTVLQDNLIAAARSVYDSSYQKRKILVSILRVSSSGLLTNTGYSAYYFPTRSNVARVLEVINTRATDSSIYSTSKFRLLVVYADSNNNIYTCSFYYNTYSAGSIYIDSNPEYSAFSNTYGTVRNVNVTYAVLNDNVFSMVVNFGPYYSDQSGAAVVFTCYTGTSGTQCIRASSALSCKSASVMGINETAFYTLCDSNMNYWTIKNAFLTYTTQYQSIIPDSSLKWGPVMKNLGDNSTAIVYYVDSGMTLKAVVVTLVQGRYSITVQNDAPVEIDYGVNVLTGIEFTVASDFMVMFSYNKGGMYYTRAASVVDNLSMSSLRVESDVSLIDSTGVPPASAQLQYLRYGSSSTSSPPVIVAFMPIAETGTLTNKYQIFEVFGGLDVLGIATDGCSSSKYNPGACNVVMKGVAWIPVSYANKYNGLYAGQKYFASQDGRISSSAFSTASDTGIKYASRQIGVALNEQELMLNQL